MFKVRVSISALMMVVVLFALEFAALRSGSDLWFSAVYTFTALLLLFAVVASKYGRRESRAFWFGFAVFGWGYLLLVVLGSYRHATYGGSIDDHRPNWVLLSSRWIATSLHWVRGNAPENGFDEPIRRQTDNITEFARCTTQIAHLMVTLTIALLGGCIAAALRGRRTNPREERTRPSKSASLVSLALAALVLSTLIGSAAFDSARASVKYFPDLVFDEEKDHNEFIVEWYAKHLDAMNEPSLWKLSQVNCAAEAYRLLWLPSFTHPATIRLVKSGDAGILRLVILEGMGGYEPGQIAIDRTIKITPEQWKELERRLADLSFWTMPTKLKDDGGSDGDQVILEGVQDGQYHLVDRWEPDAEYLELCRSIIELSRFPSLRKALDGYHTELNTK